MSTVVSVVAIVGPLSEEQRARMILDHCPLVRTIARGLIRRYGLRVEFDDLVSDGTVGLIEAVGRFDPTRGVPFAAFAERRIRGAMLDAIRGSDGNPRGVRDRRNLIERTRNQLCHQLGRRPDRSEMAEALKLSHEAYDQLVDGSVVVQLHHLDAPDIAEGTRTLADHIPCTKPNVLDRWVESEKQEAVSTAVTKLPERERKVVQLYFGEGVKYREIGRRLGVTESRVSQIRTKAVTRIRKQVRWTLAAS